MANRDPAWIRAHVEDEDDWSRWRQSPLQQVDVNVHIHYLRRWLQGQERVLEVGAGAGLFTKELAGIVERVVVVDMSEDKLARNRRNAEAMGYAGAIETWRQCNMVDLSQNYSEGEFDAVVCYGGPLSYILDLRHKAMRELVHVTKFDGLLFLSAKSLWGTVHESLPHIMRMDPRINQEIVDTGNLGPDKVAVASRFAHAYRADEFRAFIEEAGASVELMSASNCLSSTWKDLLNVWREDERTWQHLLDLELQACRQPGCLDMGSHILAIARKQA